MRSIPRLALLVVTAAAISALADVAHAQVLYWLDTSYGAPSIHRADLNGIPLTDKTLGVGTLPEGLALDANGQVYWGESAWSNARLNRTDPLLLSSAPIVSGGSTFRGVAVDDVAQLVYWTTSNRVTGSTIRRAALNGTGAVTLVALAPGANPRGIVVDHAGGKIYWADLDLSGIYRANLDGSASTLFIGLPPGSAPYGVALSPADQLVFWTEYGSGSIKSVTTGGGGQATLETGLTNPTYLTLDLVRRRMYWSEAGVGGQRIVRASMIGGLISPLPCPLTTYGGLALQPSANVSVPGGGPALPSEFALERPRPNPGNGPVLARFALPHDAEVRLSVFDLQGREVAVLAEGFTPAGVHDAQWNTDGVRAGIYFVRLLADGRQWSQRLALTN